MYRMSKSLPDDKVERLIREIKKRPVIWDTDHADYGVKNLTVMAWYDLQQLMDIPENILKTKWRNVKDMFRRECKKKKIREGDTYTGPWKHFNSLTFLFSRYPVCLDDDDDQDDDINHEENDAIPEAPIKFEEVRTEDQSTHNMLEVGYDYEEPISVPKVKSHDASKTRDEDYDTMFLQSLTQYFRSIDPVRKLGLKRKILDMIMEEFAKQ